MIRHRRNWKCNRNDDDDDDDSPFKGRVWVLGEQISLVTPSICWFLFSVSLSFSFFLPSLITESIIKTSLNFEIFPSPQFIEISSGKLWHFDIFTWTRLHREQKNSLNNFVILSRDVAIIDDEKNKIFPTGSVGRVKAFTVRRPTTLDLGKTVRRLLLTFLLFLFGNEIHEETRTGLFARRWNSLDLHSFEICFQRRLVRIFSFSHFLRLRFSHGPVINLQF